MNRYNIYVQLREDWLSTVVVKHTMVIDRIIKRTRYNLPCHTRHELNRFQTRAVSRLVRCNFLWHTAVLLPDTLPGPQMTRPDESPAPMNTGLPTCSTVDENTSSCYNYRVDLALCTLSHSHINNATAVTMLSARAASLQLFTSIQF